MPTVLRAALAAAVTAVLLVAITTGPARAQTSPFTGCMSVAFTADGDFICHPQVVTLARLRFH